MKLKDLSVGQEFRFVNGSGKTWKKLSDNGNIAVYNACLCIDDLHLAQKRGTMIIGSSHNYAMKKEAEVIII